jgi:predicted kinase
MVDRLVLVNGLPGSGKTTLVRGLAPVLSVPLISKDALKEAVADVVPAAASPALGWAVGDLMWTLAVTMPGTVILESWWFTPRDRSFVTAGLLRCQSPSVVEIWCEVPPDLAWQRYSTRRRPNTADLDGPPCRPG